MTLPDDPNVSVSLGLGGLGVGATLGDTVFGPEAGKTFNALQFHIHSSSEHTIDGETFEAEMHIVHSREAANGGVIQDIFEGVPVVDNIFADPNEEGRGVSLHIFVLNNLGVNCCYFPSHNTRSPI